MAEPIILTDSPQQLNTSGVPAWARAVFLLGVPSAIALFLVYNLATFATTGITELHRMMDVHAHEADAYVVESKATSVSILRVLQGMCLNAANNKEEQRRCLD